MSARNCRACRNWDHCKSSHDFFLPSEIRLNAVCYWQLYFLILWSPLLSTYRWPEEVSGYTDELGHSAVKSHANYEEAVVIYRSLERRLAKCGADGETLVHEILNGLTLANISPAAMSAMRYCVGREHTDNIFEWRRKKEWERTSRRHTTVGVVSKMGSQG